jgi:hypothetical protein
MISGFRQVAKAGVVIRFKPFHDVTHCPETETMEAQTVRIGEFAWQQSFLACLPLDPAHNVTLESEAGGDLVRGKTTVKGQVYNFVSVFTSGLHDTHPE